ncbi:uncharacterized protein LOC125498825 [Beta vulgaris subsp. vulgaris]|uniref:uncharacterized protein LOC125498825 n=1 Tax=Beta vulgaris subsp. vulgaris TaxID=3555 RepID=UPI002037597B|nr:uncharacterized protein LOC125498825 [Beta vulgaris subsp. vulgaris]
MGYFPGFFVVKFGSIDDRNEVLYAGPHIFYNRFMIVKPWTADFSCKEEVLKIIPIWVKLPNLPLNCWSPDSLSRIGSLLGVPLYADECTSKQLRISFARILVEIDVTKDRKQFLMVEDANGMTIKQDVRYDWWPPFCHKCQKIGRNCGVRYQHHQQQNKPRVVQKWIPKQTQPTIPTEVIPEKSVTEEMQQQPTAILERCSSNPPSAITTPIQPIVHQWKMVTRKNRGKGIIVPCFRNNEGLLLDENDEEPGIGEENTGEINAGENPYLS